MYGRRALAGTDAPRASIACDAFHAMRQRLALRSRRWHGDMRYGACAGTTREREHQMPFTVIQGSFHLVGRTAAGKDTGFEPDGDSMQ
jgi:hypothetical protein